ncbi:MAG TPA: hypothetical protein VLH59_07385 [Ignavibacteriaceae bacterium]|nr:hypothetical protein [Ignavibacteriaceae bacterium]
MGKRHLSASGGKDNVFSAEPKRIFISIKPEAYRHDLPYSKVGTSFSAANVKILCAKHNLSKSDKLLSFPPTCLPARQVFFS